MCGGHCISVLDLSNLYKILFSGAAHPRVSHHVSWCQSSDHVLRLSFPRITRGKQRRVPASYFICLERAHLPFRKTAVRISERMDETSSLLSSYSSTSSIHPAAIEALFFSTLSWTAQPPPGTTHSIRLVSVYTISSLSSHSKNQHSTHSV